MKLIAGLLAVTLALSPTMALAQNKADAIEVTMPDGTQQKGIIQDGKFIPFASDAAKPPVTQPDVIQGAIQAKAPASSTLQINYNQQPIAADIVNKQFIGYKVSIQNLGPHPVKLISAEITNGLNGQQAFQKCRVHTGARAAGYGIGFGLLTLGVGGIVAAGNAAHNSGKNKDAEAALAGYSSTFTMGVLTNGSSADAMTIVPMSVKPQVRVTYQDITSGEILSSNL